jgi:hypothetical protein
LKYEEINPKKQNSVSLIKSIIDGNFIKPTSKEKKEIQKKIDLYIKSNKFIESVNFLLLGFYFDYTTTLKNIKKRGLFRYSNYIGNKCIVKGLTDELLCLNKSFNFISNEDLNYIESVNNLSNLQLSYKQLQLIILKKIKLFNQKYKGKSLVKTLLAFSDYIFLSDFRPESKVDPLDINHRSKEEIAAAVSYLIYTITENNRQNIKDLIHVADKYINSGEISEILIISCNIIDFKEIEILIEHFDYKCELKDNKLELIPPSIDFEKSINLGYIKYELQKINDTMKSLDDFSNTEIMSLENIVEELQKDKNLILFKKTQTYGIERYRLEIPVPILDFLNENFFIKKELFKEEVIQLSRIFKEQLLTPDSLETIFIKDKLSLMEFIKINRVFSLLYLLFSKQLFKIEKGLSSEILLRSIIPVLNEDAIKQTLYKVTTSENIETYLDTLYWEPGLDSIFDLQYHPFLFIEDSFMIPLSIMAQSNSLRNLYASEYKKNNKELITDGKYDPVVDKLHNSFTKAKINSYCQTIIPKSDLDLFAVCDNSLLVFECKQSLQPINIYDLRTTYDYIKKAEKQLDHIINLYNDGILIKTLEKKHSINLSHINNLIPIIIISNKMFNGNAFKYPIRSINETTNFIKSGTMTTEKGTFSLWENEEISYNDLNEYFSKKSKIEKLYYDSVSSTKIEYKLTNPEISVNKYYLNSEIVIPELNKFTSTLRKK